MDQIILKMENLINVTKLLKFQLMSQVSGLDHTISFIVFGAVILLSKSRIIRYA